MENGPYLSVENFIARFHNKDLNKKSLESLIKCGSMDALGERTILLASVDELLAYSRDHQKQRSLGQDSLFGSSVDLPPLRLHDVQPARRSEKLMWEKELLGLFISDHPLRDYHGQMGYDNGVLTIKEFIDQKKSSQTRVGGMVTKVQKIVTKTGKPMLFAWIEDMTAKLEIVVFPTVLDQHANAFEENRIVVVSGKLNERDGVPKLMCDDVKSIATLA